MSLGTAIYAPLAAMTAATGGLFVADLSLLSAGTSSAVMDPHAVLLHPDSRFVGLPQNRVVDANDGTTHTLGARLLQDQLAGVEQISLPERPFAHSLRFNTEAFCRFLYDHLGFSFRAEQAEQAALEKARVTHLRAALERVRPQPLSTLDLYQRVEGRFASYGVTFDVEQRRSVGPFQTVGVYQWGKHVKDIVSRGSRRQGEDVFRFDEETLILEVSYLFSIGLLSQFPKTQIHLFVEREFRDLDLKFVSPHHFDFEQAGYEILGVEINGQYIGEVNSFSSAGTSEFMPAPLSAAVTRLMIQKGVLGSHKGDGARPDHHSEERISV